MDGEAQDQGEADGKDSMSRKKAITLHTVTFRVLKVTVCRAEGVLFGFWTWGCH